MKAGAAPHTDFELLSKYELHQLANQLLKQDQDAIDRCVLFILAETRGLWHGRARAMMCRRLKHCPLTQAQRIGLVTAIVARLESGSFSEQFKDQLRLAMHFEFHHVTEVCRKIVACPRRLYIRRYAQWVLLPERQPN